MSILNIPEIYYASVIQEVKKDTDQEIPKEHKTKGDDDFKIPNQTQAKK